MLSFEGPRPDRPTHGTAGRYDRQRGRREDVGRGGRADILRVVIRALSGRGPLVTILAVVVISVLSACGGSGTGGSSTSASVRSLTAFCGEYPTVQSELGTFPSETSLAQAKHDIAAAYGSIKTLVTDAPSAVRSDAQAIETDIQAISDWLDTSATPADFPATSAPAPIAGPYSDITNKGLSLQEYGRTHCPAGTSSSPSTSSTAATIDLSGSWAIVGSATVTSEGCKATVSGTLTLHQTASDTYSGPEAVTFQAVSGGGRCGGGGASYTSTVNLALHGGKVDLQSGLLDVSQSGVFAASGTTNDFSVQRRGGHLTFETSLGQGPFATDATYTQG